MVIVVEAAKAEAVARILEAVGETVVDLGALELRSGEAIVFDGALNLKGA
jgi:hypothetical protein